jgi:hypothetical protein
VLTERPDGVLNVFKGFAAVGPEVLAVNGFRPQEQAILVLVK